MEISYGVAGMDVYKSMLAVVVSDVAREGSATGSAGGVAIVGRPVCAVSGAGSLRDQFPDARPLKFQPQMVLPSSLLPPGPGQWVSRLSQP
jgi:hypothetical protein